MPYEYEDEVDETEFWDESDWDDYYEEMREFQNEEMLETASECTCGAWHITKDWRVLPVADCTCGNG